MLGSTNAGEIFSAHPGLHNCEIENVAELTSESGAQTAGRELGIVDRRRSRFLSDTVTVGSRSSGMPFIRPTSAAMRLMPSSNWSRTARSFERTVNWSCALSEMMLCLSPAIERADSDDAGLKRRNLAADQSLQRHALARAAHDDRVLAVMRGSAVRADSVDDDVDAVRRRISWPWRSDRLAGRACRQSTVEGQRDSRAWGSACRARP